MLTHRAGAAAVVTVCVDSASPTVTLDLRVARAALRTQAAVVRAVPFLGIGRGGDGFPVDKFARMAASDCELVMGFPVDVSDPRLPPEVRATRAYARTGFVLVRSAGEPERTLGELPPGSEVGIAQLDTYAGLLYGEHPNIVMHVYPDDAEMVADLSQHQLIAGLAWQPSLEALRQSSALAVQIKLLPGRHMRWDLVALYLPAAQARATLFEQGVEVLRAHQELGALIHPYQDAATVDPTATAAPIATAPRAVTRAAPRARSDVAGSHIAAVRARPVQRPAACSRKSPPAMYTREQAEQGAVVYAQNCAACHGPQLQGQPGGYIGPALKGAAFADPSYHFHVSDIFNFVSKLMPAPSPGSLSKEQDVQVMSFLLAQNGYPAGSRQLTYEQAEHSKIPLRYYGK